MFWLSRTAIDWGRMPLDHMLATIYYHLYCFFVHSDHHNKNDHRRLDNVGRVLFLTAFSAIKENAANQRRLSWKLTLRSEWRSTHSIFPLSWLNETYLAVFDRLRGWKSSADNELWIEGELWANAAPGEEMIASIFIRGGNDCRQQSIQIDLERPARLGFLFDCGEKTELMAFGAGRGS